LCIYEVYRISLVTVETWSYFVIIATN
jgi:hypothetical protein